MYIFYSKSRRVVQHLHSYERNYYFQEGVYFQSVMHSYCIQLSKGKSVEMVASVKSNYTVDLLLFHL